MQRFVEDPKDYVLRSGIRIGSEVLNKYFPGVSDESFWSTIYRSFFGPKLEKTAVQEFTKLV